jgi:hypothetical protein
MADLLAIRLRATKPSGYVRLSRFSRLAVPTIRLRCIKELRMRVQSTACIRSSRAAVRTRAISDFRGRQYQPTAT